MPRCQGITDNNQQCTREAVGELCWQHKSLLSKLPMDIIKYNVTPNLGACEDITNQGVRCARAFIYSQGQTRRDCTVYCRNNVDRWLRDLHINYPQVAIWNDIVLTVDEDSFYTRRGR